MIFPIVVGSPTVIWKLGGWAACSSGILNGRDTGGWTATLKASVTSDLISAKVVGGCCRGVRVGRESSFAGGGGGVATVSGAVWPKGPRGSDSRSKSSSFETTD